ncbi:MAG TPA: HPP family protein [Candidatus Acidoferrales bacterium]|jgi:hypothetical protein|nr:HPP family protein [Candidatus Acidoferrales bacterium]
MKRSYEVLWATVSEVGLIIIVASIGWATRQPLIFASLGPTIYELVEQPKRKSARIYNVLVGHFVALGSGFFAIWVANAWAAPSVLSTGTVSPPRIWSAAIAAALTTLLTLLLKATQPAALSTTLLVSLGSMQTRRGAEVIVIGVLLVVLLGAPVRHLRLRVVNSTE